MNNNKRKMITMTLALTMMASGTAVASYADVQMSKIGATGAAKTTSVATASDNAVVAYEAVPAKDISKMSFSEFVKDMDSQKKMTSKAVAEAEKLFNLYKKELAAKNYKSADQTFMKLLKAFGIEVEFSQTMSTATLTATDTTKAIQAAPLTKPAKSGK